MEAGTSEGAGAVLPSAAAGVSVAPSVDGAKDT